MMSPKKERFLWLDVKIQMVILVHNTQVPIGLKALGACCRLDMDTIATQHPQMLGVLKRRLAVARVSPFFVFLVFVDRKMRAVWPP